MPRAHPACPKGEASVTSSGVELSRDHVALHTFGLSEAAAVQATPTGDIYTGMRTVREQEQWWLLQGGVWYQKCYDPECRQYRSQIMPLPPAIMQRLQADTTSAALQSTTGAQVHTAQPSAQMPSDGMAQELLLPSAPQKRDACTEPSDPGDMGLQLADRSYENQKENMNSIGGNARTMDDIISAQCTGVFSDNTADDVFDKELLRLFERCDRARDGM